VKVETQVIMNFSISDSNLEVFPLLVNQGRTPSFLVIQQGMIQVWDKAAADFFGFRAGEVIGLSLDVIIPMYLRHAIRRALAKQ